MGRGCKEGERNKKRGVGARRREGWKGKGKRKEGSGKERESEREEVITSGDLK